MPPRASQEHPATGQWQMLQRLGSALPRELLARPNPKLALVLSAQVPAIDLNPVNTRI